MKARIFNGIHGILDVLGAYAAKLISDELPALIFRKNFYFILGFFLLLSACQNDQTPAELYGTWRMKALQSGDFIISADDEDEPLYLEFREDGTMIESQGDLLYQEYEFVYEDGMIRSERGDWLLDSVDKFVLIYSESKTVAKYERVVPEL